MSAILKWRTARKTYRCEFCREPIKPGERYVSAALPPHDNDIGNTTWWRSASHGEDGYACPAYWLVDNPYDRPLSTPVPWNVA